MAPIEIAADILTRDISFLKKFMNCQHYNYYYTRSVHRGTKIKTQQNSPIPLLYDCQFTKFYTQKRQPGEFNC